MGNMNVKASEEFFDIAAEWALRHRLDAGEFLSTTLSMSLYIATQAGVTREEWVLICQDAWDQVALNAPPKDVILMSPDVGEA